MAKPEIDLTLYMVTDRDLMSSPTLEENIAAACRGGVTLVQVREKHTGTEEYIRIAKGAKAVTDSFGIPMIVDDDVDAAIGAGAAGVHVGQGDTPAGDVRKRIGPDMILGVSAHTVEQAVEAERAGADYLGVGAFSFTATKPESEIITIDDLRRILDAVSIPVVVIGGINAKTIPNFKGLPIAGYSAVSAIVSADDVEAAAREMREVIGR